MLIKALVELVDKAGGREAIRARLLERARAAATEQATAEEPLALRHLQKQLDALEENIATAQRRMTTEQDDNRYQAIAKTFDSLIDEKTTLTKQITELAAPPQPAVDALSPESQVDELMAMLDSLENLAETPDANQQIRDLVLRLGIYIGLDFEEGRWGKRKVRKLRRGVIAFGKDNLPIPIHGRNCTGLETNAARETSSRKNIHSAPACCREPAAEHVSNRGDGTVNNQPGESRSEVDQTHQGTNVGATGLEPATFRPPAERSTRLSYAPYLPGLVMHTRITDSRQSHYRIRNTFGQHASEMKHGYLTPQHLTATLPQDFTQRPPLTP